MCPPTLGAARVPTSRAAAPPSGSALTGAELPQAKKKKDLVFMGTVSLWSCPTVCDPVDCGLPGLSVREWVLQARILEHIE